jgi:undecaprenyl diphosphate synthase
MIETVSELKNILVVAEGSTVNGQRLTFDANSVHRSPFTVHHSKPSTARTRLLNIFKSMLLNNEDLSPEAIRTKFSPEPDLIIIEGEHSLQNAAIIEASYAELYFCNLLNEAQMEKAVEDFYSRKRNFGV